MFLTQCYLPQGFSLNLKSKFAISSSLLRQFLETECLGIVYDKNGNGFGDEAILFNTFE